jgi:hypothetical protein
VNSPSKDSFINLGLLNQIRNKDASRIRVYPWDESDIGSLDDDVAFGALSDIISHVEKLDKSKSFKMDHDGHVIVLVRTLLDIFLALKFVEISAYLEQLGIVTQRRTLVRYLFVLEKLGVIEKYEYSDIDFYFSTGLEFHYVQFASSLESIRVDRVRTNCMAYYEDTESESHRRISIRKFRELKA